MPAPRKRPGGTRSVAALALGVVLGGAVPVAATLLEQEGPPAPAVLFELMEPRPSGVLEPGTPVQLEIRLTGLPPREEESVVAIIEGESFTRRLLPMRLDEDSNTFRSQVVLEPDGSERSAGHEKAVRLRATIAQVQGMVLDHIVTRVVYVTMQRPAEAATVTTAPFDRAAQDLSLEFTETRLDTRGPLEGTEGAAFSEEDIIPNPVPAEAQAYWRQVSERIGQIWRQPDLPAPAQEGTPGVRVRFRLHANGEAQLIQVERSSGVPEIDEAGLSAVLQAHPFPPFPPDVRDEVVDMHIELGRTRGVPPLPSGQNGVADMPLPPVLDPPLKSQ